MNAPAAIMMRRGWPWILAPLLFAAIGGFLALSGRPIGFLLAVAAAAAYFFFVLASIEKPLVLVTGLLLVLEVLPPFYFNTLGETPIYASFFALPIVMAVIVMRLPDIRWQWDPLSKGLVAFLAATAASIPFAFWLSGTSTGLNSLSRWL